MLPGGKKKLPSVVEIVMVGQAGGQRDRKKKDPRRIRRQLRGGKKEASRIAKKGKTHRRQNRKKGTTPSSETAGRGEACFWKMSAKKKQKAHTKHGWCGMGGGKPDTGKLKGKDCDPATRSEEEGRDDQEQKGKDKQKKSKGGLKRPEQKIRKKKSCPRGKKEEHRDERRKWGKNPN